MFESGNGLRNCVSKAHDGMRNTFCKTFVSFAFQWLNLYIAEAAAVSATLEESSRDAVLQLRADISECKTDIKTRL